MTAMLTAVGVGCVHVPGLAVNRARRATRGGENKSDPRDARVIADQVRMRDDLRIIDVPTDVDLRLLIALARHFVSGFDNTLERHRDSLRLLLTATEGEDGLGDVAREISHQFTEGLITLRRALVDETQAQVTEGWTRQMQRSA